MDAAVPLCAPLGAPCRSRVPVYVDAHSCPAVAWLTRAQVSPLASASVPQTPSTAKWTPRRPTTEHEAAEKLARALLNKLTPEKFDKLMQQFCEIPITAAKTLTALVSLAVAKTVDEPEFVALYTNFFVAASDKLPVVAGEDGVDVQFMVAFVQQLRSLFDDGPEGFANWEIEAEAEEEVRCRVQRQRKGCLNLIAELFNRGILDGEELIGCADQMLRRSVADLEGVCTLLNAAGATLEQAHGPVLKPMLLRLHAAGGEQSLPSRLRFMIQDTLDRAKGQWTPRRKITIDPRMRTETAKEACSPLTNLPTDKTIRDSKGRQVVLKKLGAAASPLDMKKRSAWWT